VILGGITANPDESWMLQQARNITMEWDDFKKPTHLIMDRDTKFTQKFRDIIASDDVEIVRIPPRSPNLNAFAERWIQSCKTEVLDYFISFSEGHLRHLVTEYIDHYNEHRPHQGLSNAPHARPIALSRWPKSPRLRAAVHPATGRWNQNCKCSTWCYLGIRLRLHRC
jgi:putative transposase